jgi:hypothetical protein
MSGPCRGREHDRWRLPPARMGRASGPGVLPGRAQRGWLVRMSRPPPRSCKCTTASETSVAPPCSPSPRPEGSNYSICDTDEGRYRWQRWGRVVGRQQHRRSEGIVGKVHYPYPKGYRAAWLNVAHSPALCRTVRRSLAQWRGFASPPTTVVFAFGAGRRTIWGITRNAAHRPVVPASRERRRALGLDPEDEDPRPVPRRPRRRGPRRWLPTVTSRLVHDSALWEDAEAEQWARGPAHRRAARALGYRGPTTTAVLGHPLRPARQVSCDRRQNRRSEGHNCEGPLPVPGWVWSPS